VANFIQYTVLGLVIGGVYGIAAAGLVVTYTTSGIFNFAHGAIAMLAAFSYCSSASAGTGPRRSPWWWCSASWPPPSGRRSTRW
jgi:branched-subunit amino acid ABC-type transport system permease component